MQEWTPSVRERLGTGWVGPRIVYLALHVRDGLLEHRGLVLGREPFHTLKAVGSCEQSRGWVGNVKRCFCTVICHLCIKCTLHIPGLIVREEWEQKTWGVCAGKGSTCVKEEEHRWCVRWDWEGEHKRCVHRATHMWVRKEEHKRRMHIK